MKRSELFNSPVWTTIFGILVLFGVMIVIVGVALLMDLGVLALIH